MEQTVHNGCRERTPEEQYALLEQVIGDYAADEKNLIQILHMAQAIFGYLPLPVQRFVAERMDIPLSRVSGVVTFYSFFSTQPKGRHTIQICLGTACYVRGGKRVVEHLRDRLGVELGGTTEDGKFTLEVARCIGACGLAPAMMIDDVVYKQVNVNKMETILSKY